MNCTKIFSQLTTIFFLHYLLATFPTKAMHNTRALNQAIEDNDLAGVMAIVSQNPACIDGHYAGGKTPLMQAIRYGRSEIIKILVDHGANYATCVKHAYGLENALHYAAQFGSSDIIRLIAGNGAACLTLCLGMHPRLNQHSLLRMLPRDIFQAICSFLKPLFYKQSYQDHKKFVINARDYRGMTPLHRAVANRYLDDFEIIQFLIQCGADINAQDDQGYTPVHLLLQNSPGSSCLDIFFSYGANFLIHCFKSSLHFTREDETCCRDVFCHVNFLDFLQIDCIEKASSNIILAFYLAMHPRVGTHSPARILSPDNFRDISKYLTPKKLFQDNQAVKTYTLLYQKEVRRERDESYSAYQKRVQAAQKTWCSIL